MLTVVASAVYLEINPNVLEDFKNTVINNGAFFILINGHRMLYLQ